MLHELRNRGSLAVMALAVAVLCAAAHLRSMEYDESYTVFLAAGDPRPAWPTGAVRIEDLGTQFAGASTFGGIARDLRATDVHPPLYFWAVSAWRSLFGTSLWTTRLFSVACSLAALMLVGAIAVHVGVPPTAAMLLTLGCYGFAYTGHIARGFALAQALSVGGVLLLLIADRRASRVAAFAGGALLGAAALTNYLASFVAAAAIGWFVLRRWRDWRLWPAAPAGFIAFLPAVAWFFLAQRDSRAGQFPPFHLLASAIRLAAYACANLFGGLPLYLDGAARPAAEAAVSITAALLAVLVVGRWRHIGSATSRALLGMAAAAPVLGLLALGIVFDNTPIELRYLAFATPFAALLVTGAINSLPRVRTPILVGVLTLQAAAIGGLLLRQETMQPQRWAARASAATLGTGGLALVPFGNDGVGIVGSFVTEAPATLRILLVRPDALPDPEMLPATRATIALLPLDAASRATIPKLRSLFDTSACWIAVPASGPLLRYDRRC